MRFIESSSSALGLLWFQLLLYDIVLVHSLLSPSDPMTFRQKASAPSARITPGNITLSKMTEGSLQMTKMMTRRAKMNSLMPPKIKLRLLMFLSPRYTHHCQRKRHCLSPPRVSSRPHRNSSFSLVLPVRRLRPARRSKQPLR